MSLTGSAHSAPPHAPSPRHRPPQYRDIALCCVPLHTMLHTSPCRCIAFNCLGPVECLQDGVARHTPVAGTIAGYIHGSNHWWHRGTRSTAVDWCAQLPADDPADEGCLEAQLDECLPFASFPCLLRMCRPECNERAAGASGSACTNLGRRTGCKCGSHRCRALRRGPHH